MKSELKRASEYFFKTSGRRRNKEERGREKCNNELVTILTGEDGEGYDKETREMLVKFPGLLVLGEGHNGWNEQSLVWKALRKFAADLEQKWGSLNSSTDKNARALEELRDIISPLVHKPTFLPDSFYSDVLGTKVTNWREPQQYGLLGSQCCSKTCERQIQVPAQTLVIERHQISHRFLVLLEIVNFDQLLLAVRWRQVKTTGNLKRLTFFSLFLTSLDASVYVDNSIHNQLTTHEFKQTDWKLET
ncbi:hypothetical protein H5410_062268 [Solanum commersonii]|uniref:Uncharacterized protein n=1 Tax=Solanum commersonii TaxID=4109 RepID=A0A9J5WC47_SOLCO|nr:hypothetical protein H5410_062268 [Solanum commersonii]